MSTKATEQELLELVAERYDAGDTLNGGGVDPETIADDLPITPKQVARRLGKLADAGKLERDYGFGEGWNHRTGFAPVDNTEADEPRRLIADGGTDNSHADVVARQLAEADDETLEEIGATDDTEGDQ